ncbi:GDP-mannose mannosyl hydrolase [Francisellaceae bacterium]|nr:GDP-mannose mannosyl hydrolase [Francisellaceae bacterium]
MNQQKFLQVLDSTPLISIDIILKDASDKVLLGYRNNRPAQGYWFVPGGRIRKNETLEKAMSRISKVELGFEIALDESRLLGAYDHIYEDNFQGVQGVNTHYVALGHEVILPEGQILTFDSQHSEIKWWSIEDLLASEIVHENTKAYFRGR